jgi:hypothetical protein
MKKIIYGFIVVCLLNTTSHLLHAEDSASQDNLKARAKISEAQARSLALSKVVNGVIKSSELEEENGKLIYSFDITTPGTTNITEVAVDAISSAIVDVSIETPKDQAKEAAADKKEAKKMKASKEKDEDDEKEEKK